MEEGSKVPEALDEDQQQLQERLMGYAAGAFAISSLTIGDKLGLYAALAARGPCTPQQLADACSPPLHERWVREWLLHQATCRIVSCDAGAASFWLTQAQQDVLVNEEGPSASPHFAVGGMTAIPHLGAKVDELCDAFRSGLGLKYDAYGPHVACAVARDLRVWPRFNLINAIKALPKGVDAKLRAGARVADIGCGEGELLMLLAAEYPASQFEGYDTSRHALEAGREAIAAAGLGNLSLRDASDPSQRLPEAPVLDLAITNDALHDMARPDQAMAAVRKAIKPDGCWLIGDFDAGDASFNVHKNPAAPLLYGFSLHLCMSSSMSEPGGLGLGTCGFSEPVARRLLAEAGWGAVQRLQCAPFNNHPLMVFWLVKP